MVAHAETSNKALDTVKLILAIAILLAGIGAFYYFALQPLVYRVLGMLVVTLISMALFFASAIGHAAWNFIKDSRVELRKVVWPTRQETFQATLVVVGLVILVGIFLWLLDMFLFWGTGILTGQKV